MKEDGIFGTNNVVLVRRRYNLLGSDFLSLTAMGVGDTQVRKSDSCPLQGQIYLFYNTHEGM